jgi:hypothetical protein
VLPLDDVRLINSQNYFSIESVVQRRTMRAGGCLGSLIAAWQLGMLEIVGRWRLHRKPSRLLLVYHLKNL